MPKKNASSTSEHDGAAAATTTAAAKPTATGENPSKTSHVTTGSRSANGDVDPNSSGVLTSSTADSRSQKSKSPWGGFLFGVSLAVILVAFFIAGATAQSAIGILPQNIITLIWPHGGDIPVDGSQSGASKLSEVMGGLNTNISVADVVEAAGTSVVTVAVKTKQPVYQQVPGMFPGFNFQIPSGQVQEVQQDIGTGFVVDSNNGFVVTNRHVVGADNVEYKIIDVNNKEYEVTNIFRDPSADLALIKVKDLSLPALPLGDSDQARVGDAVIAIGTALGEFRNTVTTGVVSGKGRGIEASSGNPADSEKLENVIQTDAAINPGNSGGPLISFKGDVIGVNVAMTQGAQNIAFAIPINLVKQVIDNFNQTGQFDRARLGVQYELISAKTAALNDWPQGAYVTAVVPGSAAEKAGIKENDIIFKIDDQLLKDTQLSELINGKRIGDTIKLSVWRDGSELDISATLESATAQ